MRQKPGCALAVLVTALVLLGAIGIGVRALTATGMDLVIAPGATEIQIRSLSLWEQQISYRAADSHYEWYVAVVRNLGAAGWSAPIDSRVRLQSRPDVHWRIVPLWGVYLKERVALQGDPGAARITVSRELIIPWRLPLQAAAARMARWLPNALQQPAP